MTPQDKKNLLGHQAYILEGVKSLASIKSYVMKVTSPAETIEGEFIYGMVTNTVSVGGFKGLINQNVSLSDGLFEVLLIRMPKTPLEFSSIVTGLLMREEETSDLIYKFKASELHIEAQEPVDWVLDGDSEEAKQQCPFGICRSRLRFSARNRERNENMLYNEKIPAVKTENNENNC